VAIIDSEVGVEPPPRNFTAHVDVAHHSAFQFVAPQPGGAFLANPYRSSPRRRER